jgi:acyl-CoA thioester hydrolase
MPFNHPVEVLPEDIDRLGHASNQVYLRWVLEAALAHSTALGFGEEAWLARGQAWVVRRHELKYLRPALPGDRLDVETRVATLSAASSLRLTRILRRSDGALLCSAATDWVYVELPGGRPIRIPADVRARFPLEP